MPVTITRAQREVRRTPRQPTIMTRASPRSPRRRATDPRPGTEDPCRERMEDSPSMFHTLQDSFA
jgi:hypothetical protein